MKKTIFFLCTFFIAVSAYSAGNRDLPLVNEQSIALNNIRTLDIAYRSEEIVILKSNNNSIVVREYMSRDNSSYYANISSSGDSINIRQGSRPVSLGWFSSFHVRVEVYIPEDLIQNLTVRTSSGRIRSNVHLSIPRMSFYTTSGSIALTGLTGNTTTEASSGRITIEQITGSLNAKTSSGSINVSALTGSINAEARSGRISCSLRELSGDIILSATSGRIELFIPQNSSFNFSARRTSGNLTTAFSESLNSPINDRRLAQGTIGNSPNHNINLRTTSGSITVRWH